MIHIYEDTSTITRAHMNQAKTPSIVCIPVYKCVLHLLLSTRDIKYSEIFSAVIHGQLSHVGISPLVGEVDDYDL